ncbi:hypothetical protein Scep_020957 [Stephania cephalantha]|uniref:HMA domain-containing protein n=1 Tax=Stephania cephalantha TaxID=152367 RepID=A0AAP0HWE8_9MAGN
MGEEVKAEEKKAEEGVKEEKKTEEKKTGEEEKKTGEEPVKEPPPPPPAEPEEIVLKVYMHCEGCARKVKKCLKGFQGVEDVETDCKAHKVIVKGKQADPLKVLERVQKKSHRQVELLSPIPKPPSPDEEKKTEEEKPKPEEKKEEPPVITVILKVYMHCEACAQEIRKRIMRMKGVESADPDLKSSEVAVKGVFDPPKLVEYVYKRTGKHAVIVKTEAQNAKEDENANKEEKKTEEKKDESAAEKEKSSEAEKTGGEEEKKKEGDVEGKEGGGAATDDATAGAPKVELIKNEFYYYPPKYAYGYAQPYPPQIFSDENPNACSVM